VLEPILTPCAASENAGFVADTPDKASAPDAAIDSVLVVTQGVVLSLEASLVWLYHHFSYPDNFLHILCILPSKPG